MSERVVLTADEGMVYTNGTDYGKIVYPGEGVDPATFYQITEAEYNAIVESEQAESDDYETALARLGVE